MKKPGQPLTAEAEPVMPPEMQGIISAGMPPMQTQDPLEMKTVRGEVMKKKRQQI